MFDSLFTTIILCLSYAVFLCGVPLVYFLIRCEAVNQVKLLRPRRCAMLFVAYGVYLVYHTVFVIRLRPLYATTGQIALEAVDRRHHHTTFLHHWLSRIGITSLAVHKLVGDVVFSFSVPFFPLMGRHHLEAGVLGTGQFNLSLWLPASPVRLMLFSLLESASFAFLVCVSAVYAISVWRTALQVVSRGILNQPIAGDTGTGDDSEGMFLGVSTSSVGTDSRQHLEDDDEDDLYSNAANRRSNFSPQTSSVSTASSLNYVSSTTEDERNSASRRHDPLSDENPSFFEKFSKRVVRSLSLGHSQELESKGKESSASSNPSVGDGVGLMPSRLSRRLSRFTRPTAEYECSSTSSSSKTRSATGGGKSPRLSPHALVKKWYAMTSMFWLPNTLIYVTLCIPFFVSWVYTNVIGTVSRALLAWIVRDGEPLDQQPVLVQQLAAAESQYMKLLFPNAVGRLSLHHNPGSRTISLNKLPGAMSWCFCPPTTGYHALIAIGEMLLIRLLFATYLKRLRLLKEVQHVTVKEPRLFTKLFMVQLAAHVVLQVWYTSVGVWGVCMLLSSLASTGVLLQYCYEPFLFIRDKYTRLTGRTLREVLFSRDFKPFPLENMPLEPTAVTPLLPRGSSVPPLSSFTVEKDSGPVLPQFLATPQEHSISLIPTIDGSVSGQTLHTAQNNSVEGVDAAEDPTNFWKNIAVSAAENSTESPAPQSTDASQAESFSGTNLSFCGPTPLAGDASLPATLDTEHSGYSSQLGGGASGLHPGGRPHRGKHRAAGEDAFNDIRGSVLLTTPPVPGFTNASFVSGMTAPSGTSSSGNATPGNGLFEDSSSMTHHEALEPIQIDANALLAGVAGSPLPINLQSSGQDDGSSFCDTEKGQSSSEGGARVIDEDDGFYTFIEQIYKCNDDVNTLQPFLHPHGTVYVREKVDEEGYTPLHHAVQGASVNVIRFLFELGADPDARNEDGLTPLHLAVVSRAEAERVFSDNKAATDTTVDDIDRMKRKRGRQYYYNFLQAAVSNPRGVSYGKVEQIGVVTALLAGGATVDYPTFECQTALHLAIRQGEIGVLNTLLRAGADPWIQFTAASVKRDRHVPTWPVVHLQHAGEAWGTCVTTPDEEENPLTTMVIAKGYRTQQETTSRGVSSASLHYYKCPMMLAVELGNAIAVESMLHVLDIQLIERHIENKKREAGQPYDTLSVSSIATPSLHSGTATAPSSTSTDPRLLFEEQAYVRLLTLPRCHHNLTYLMVALALGNAEVVLTLLRKKLEEVTSTQLLQFELGDTNTEEGEEAAEEEDTASAFSTNTGEYEMDKRRLGNAFHFAAIGNSSECLAFLLDAFEVPDILQPYFMEGNDVKVLNYFSARDNRYAAVRNQKDTPTTKVEEETENRPWSVTAAAECGGDSPLAKSIHHVLLKSPNAEESLETKKNAFVKDFLTSVLVFRQQQTNSGAGTSVLTVQLPKAFSHSHNSDTSVNSSGTSSGSPKVILSLPSEDGSESLVISKLFYNTRVTNTHARVILRRSRRKEARFNAKRAPPIGNKDETKFLLCTSRKRITTVPPLDFSKAVSTLRMRLPGFPIDLPHLNTLEAAVDALCGGGEALNFKFIDRLLGSPATDSTGGSSDGPSAVTLTAAERKELQQALLCVSRRLRLGKLTTEMEEIYAAAKRGRVPGSHVRALHRQAFRGEGAGPIVSSLPSEDSLEESDEDSGSGSGSGSAPSPGVETLPDAELSASNSVRSTNYDKRCETARQVLATMETVKKALNRLDENKLTPLHYAIMNRNANLILILCAYGAQFVFGSQESRDVLSQRVRSTAGLTSPFTPAASTPPVFVSSAIHVSGGDTVQPEKTPQGKRDEISVSPSHPLAEGSEKESASGGEDHFSSFTNTPKQDSVLDEDHLLSSPDMQTVDITPPKKMPFDTENMALDSFLVDTKVTTVTGSDNPGLYHHGKPPLAVTTSGTSRIQSQLVLNQVKQQVEEKVGPLLALSEEYRTHFPHYVLEALDTAADGDGAVGFLCSMESNRNLLLHRIHTNTNKANGVAEASPLLRSPVAAGPPDKSLLQPCESTSLFPSMCASTSARRAKDYAFFNGMLEPHDVLLLHTCGRDAMGGEVLLRAAMEGVDLHQRVMHYLNSFVPVEKGSEKEE